GYIVSIRLVRADSGIELASFLESGDGPRGLIDAADKLARALRSRAGESLRDVNATPPLAQATTGSLEALRKFSEAARANALGDRKAVTLAREAVALDSTFASGWSALGAMLSNYGSSRSAIDSALVQAYRFRNRVSEAERERIVSRYFAMGPGRDRAKAIAAMEALAQSGDNAVRVNLGEQLRSRREYARAESLNVEAWRRNPGNGTALGNTVEMQINQGKFREAAATAARLRELSAPYGTREQFLVVAAEGGYPAMRRMADSLRRLPGELGEIGTNRSRDLALMEGRMRDRRAMRERSDSSREDNLFDIEVDAIVFGASEALERRLERVIASIRFAELPMVDRPYLYAASLWARIGKPDKARAMLARYRAEMTDTSVKRVWEADVHSVMGGIALAENLTQEALAEFRRGDVSYDGAPRNECAPCLPFALARVFDAAGQTDSAIVMYEKYIATPFWLKPFEEFDPVLLPKIRERLGHLYESQANMEKAAENYRAFVDLWKNADPELQPRVAAAREKLRRMSLDAPRR
ncbi:MAG: hypothetical protein ACRENU_01595, partial [Gemmatimonadaceae bacterium]